ncbi:MAG TPA: BREX-1 system adenine-specific DNA-methyltransferase PglX [Ktedonobacteraceae bacterium]|nr:BREX-1 system adenine-specific DNA-methyltransferase PglX [Ktedonobacteraceae bacterium]
MQKRHKDLIRTLVTELRHILVGTVASDGTVLRGDLDRELERLGIAPDGTITPLDALANATPSERLAHRIAAAQLELVAQAQRASTRMEIIERAAYSWINRLLALRAMETRGLIDETLRTNPDYDGLPEALFILRQSDPGRAAGADGGRWAVLEDACQSQARSLPGLFALDDPATALRPSTPALIRCMAFVGGAMPGFTLAESDATFADPDAIGWAYQFYQEEAKARIYAKLGSGGKAVTRSEIAAATELFTEPYMVKWLLQNSLGRSYHEIYPDSTLPATWDYYVKPDTLDTSTTFNLASLTLLDPCMGSGHFLREALDMFVAMYREQFQTFSATEIADRILSHHLHGIDLDPRAAQLSALTLYLRAWELVRDERRKERKPSPGTYIPPAMNLATTPTSLNEGALQRHLLRHPQDMPLKPLLEGIFSGLEQAGILGSLIRPKEYLDNAIAELQRPHTIRMDFDPEEAELRRTITAMANHDPVGLRQRLLDRIADSFKSEAGNTDDVSAALFGREAEQGVRLLQLLDRRYAVVVTNPPYMGSKNMDTPLKKYVEKYYPSGKRDLYAVFILRCIELCRHGGRVAMLTMQSWMFLRSFAKLRAMPDEKISSDLNNRKFTGVLRETTFEALTHLGRYAFSELGNAVIAPLMFILKASRATRQNQFWACRITAPRPSEEQATLLMRTVRLGKATKMLFTSYQTNFLSIPETPIVYWLRPKFFTLLQGRFKLGNIAEVRQGLATADNERFTRCFWEAVDIGKVNEGRPSGRWFWYAKGGRYQKWTGLMWLLVDWENEGQRVRSCIDPHTGRPRARDNAPHFFFRSGLTYTLIAQGSFAARILNNAIFGNAGSSIFLKNDISQLSLLALTSARIASYLLRVTTQDIKFQEGYVANLPLCNNLPLDLLGSIGNCCINLKQALELIRKPQRW